MSARNGPCVLLRIDATHFAIRNCPASVSPRGGATHLQVSVRASVGGQPEQSVLHLSPSCPAADPEGVQRRDVGLDLGVTVGAGRRARSAQPSPASKSTKNTRAGAAGLGDDPVNDGLLAEVALAPAALDVGPVEADADEVVPLRTLTTSACGPTAALSLSMTGGDLGRVAGDPDAGRDLARVRGAGQRLHVDAGVDRDAQAVAEQRLDVLGQREAGLPARPARACRRSPSPTRPSRCPCRRPASRPGARPTARPRSSPGAWPRRDRGRRRRRRRPCCRPLAENSASTAPSSKRTTPAAPWKSLNAASSCLSAGPARSGLQVAAVALGLLGEVDGDAGGLLRGVHRHDAGVAGAVHPGREVLVVGQRRRTRRPWPSRPRRPASRRSARSRPRRRCRLVLVAGALLIARMPAFALSWSVTWRTTRGLPAVPAVGYGGHGDPVADPGLDVALVVEALAVTATSGSRRTPSCGGRRGC